MKPIQLVADSTCDLSPELIERYHISIVPLYVTMGDESHKDDDRLSKQAMFDYTARTKQTPKTAAATIDDYLQEFRRHVDAGRDVVYVGLSSKMSSTVSNAVIAASELPEGAVEVVDSENLSTGIGLLVLLAARLAEQGRSAAEIAATLRSGAGRVRASFVIDTLMYLYRGGRCTAVQAFGANALNLKPEIVVTDGQMHPDRKYRGNIVRCAQKYAEDVLNAAVRPDPTCVFITYSPSDPALVEAVRQVVEARGIFQEIHLTDAGSVVTSHCGPNTIGVLYMEQE